MEKTLLRATEEWVEALARAATDLSVASKRIQEELADANERAESSGLEAIPDLINLVQRVQNLEKSMIHLQQASKDIANQREMVLSNTFEQIQNNQRLLSKLSRHLDIPAPSDS